MIKLALLAGILGHLLCGASDCLLGYSRKGRLNMKNLSDPEKMSEMFADMPEKFPLASILLGTFAIALFGLGYLGLSAWISAYSAAASVVMFIASAAYLVPITAHHVLFGAIEWLYLRLGRISAAREAVLALQKKTIAPMFAGYAGLLVFVVTLFAAVVSGSTPLPAWACVFNTLVVMVLLLPTKLPAKGNIAGAVMFLGLIFLA